MPAASVMVAAKIASVVQIVLGILLNVITGATASVPVPVNSKAPISGVMARVTLAKSVVIAGVVAVFALPSAKLAPEGE